MTCSVVATVCITVTGAAVLPGGACVGESISYDAVMMSLGVKLHYLMQREEQR